MIFSTETPSIDDIATTSPTQPTCPDCGTAFTRVPRQRFCSSACRKTAWARGQRLAATVYACPDCDTRYHGLQWCPDCHTPCVRVGPGGCCTYCDEPVTIADLFTPTHDVRPR